MIEIFFTCPNCNIIYDENNKNIKIENIKTKYKLEQKYCKLCSDYKKWEMKEYG